ncbi:hypothetical protein GOQ27_05745 [Clostridium sp. D2Q-11]|uniref:GRAM domain-containing protein n=1 Tax=Anaeromonas frigoriresistens TaxID=2683708 RepID=A0A942Z8G1_9FIRM|nr:hypothetical protein [Anaeromonas frigoriresistens]
MEKTDNEQIHFNVLANLFRGNESVGGKLKITDKRLIFKSHALNIQTGVTEIPIEKIVKVNKRNTLRIVPNGMSIITQDGIEYKFVLWSRGKIINFINNRIANH